MYLVLRLWTLLASCLASLALRQGERDIRSSNYDDDADRKQDRLSSAGRGSAPPEQLHLALADPRGKSVYAVSICWYTLTDAKSEVFWGREDTLGKVTAGNSTRECLVVFAYARFAQ